MCVCARARVCVCVCHALYENVNFHMFCTLVYLRIVCVSLSSVAKRFEFLKALCKFPIIIIVIITCGLGTGRISRAGGRFEGEVQAHLRGRH